MTSSVMLIEAAAPNIANLSRSAVLIHTTATSMITVLLDRLGNGDREEGIHGHTLEGPQGPIG